MSHESNEIVISCRVRLARNYFDLPFSTATHPQNAQICIDRAGQAVQSGSGSPYQLKQLKDMQATEKTALMEQHLISRDLLQNSPSGAAFMRDDHAVSIMVNEEDHLRIQGLMQGLRLPQAAELAFQAEEALQSVCAFSFDSQLGYLTACPTNTGTGMRASLMLHLPLLTSHKQMGDITQSVAKLGLTIRGIYGEGSEALGDLYQVSNQVTLGRTEKEILEAVTAVGHKLIDMENSLRNADIVKSSCELQDCIFRSYGILRYALQMDANEFMRHWSHLRLGTALKLLPVELSISDELLTIAQDAHAKLYLAKTDPSLSTNQARAKIIRSALTKTI